MNTKQGQIITTPDPPVTERTIGATTYIVTAEYSKTATETAVEKIRRILQNLK